MMTSKAFLNVFEGKQIFCSVLYIDIVGSTKLVHSLPPEKRAFFYKTFLDEMIAVVHDFGGFVLDTAGDCVIAFFPAIKLFITAADRTILCGLVMIEIVKKSLSSFFLKNDLPEIQCRVGADFGEVSVIEIGPNDHFIKVDMFGDVMNVAKKIQDKANRNTMFIGRHLFEVIYTDYRLSCTEKGRIALTNGEFYQHYRVNYIL